MQMKQSHRILAAVLALVMVLGLLPTSAFAKAAGNDGSAEMNEAYAAHESLMPIGPSFNVDTLLEWTPESDPDAAYSKASIPLADRVGGFVVNPLVNPEAKLMLCSLANSDHDHTSAQGTESFLSYAFNYWQYTGSFVYWSGSEEGLICCPTGEFTDAAHTNGVPVVATLGFPWGSGTGYVEQVRQFVQKAEDGSFPVADKLIEVMDYYGFDGYFFNQESYGCSAAEGALIDEMMRYMHKLRPDMLISWYDSMLPTGSVSYQNAVTDSNKQFMTDSEDGTRAIDEFFMNYNWGQREVNTTISTMKSIGRSEFDAFAGIDVQQNCMDTAFQDYLLVDEDGMTRLSLALYCPNSTLGLSTSGENFHEVEQVFYTNAKGDPRDTSVDLNTSDWAGMSRFFADHTVITKAPFVTNFNSGHGKGYYVDGVLSRDAEWSYQSNQDVMPTWTWIIDSEGQKLEGGYDFTDAYNGGNSIKFAGSLTAGKANDIMLYSTQVAVESGMKLGLTYKNDGGLMKLVAYYGDANTASYEDCTKVEYALTAGEADTWTTTEADLSANAGKTLYAIGLKVESSEDVANYQVNLGRLTLTEKTRAALNGPSSITLDEILYKDAYTAEARVYWNAVTGASSYEIYKVYADGSKSLIMETPNNAFYIPTLTRDADETDVTLEVVALNRNGVRGKGSTMTIDWAYGNDDSDKITKVDFENVCLNAEVTDVSYENSGEPASKALDGTAANNSKWCASLQSTGYMCIDVGREVTVKRWRVEHGEYGGEDKATNTKDFALEYKDASGEWVQAMRIQNNTSAVTDVLLDEPVTAQEWKLRIYDDGDSQWVAIRIYEWQMFETDEFPQTEPVPMHFASAVNNAGAADTFTLQNVANGQTVKVYTKSAEDYTLIGEQTATAAGTVTLSDLDFGTAEAGRVYYTTTAMAAKESVKLSAPFEAETAEKSAPAEDVTFAAYSRAGSVSSSNGDDIYTKLTVKDLAPGDVIYVYENGADAGYTKASLPVAAGETTVSVDGIRVVRAGGTLSLQVKRNGKLISDVYTVNTPTFAEPTATLRLFARNESGETLTGVRYGVYGEDGEKVIDISTTSDSGGKAELPLGTYTLKCESVPEGYSPNREQVVRILGIEGWTYTVTVSIPDYADPAVSSVAIAPADAVVMPGKTASFQATVTGVGAYSEDVTWSLSGAKSQDTTLSADGKLTVGADETAYYLTVTATSAQDGTTYGSVNVILGVLTNVAKDAQVFIYNGSLQGQENGPENLVDGDLSTKWQEGMVANDNFLLAGLYLGQYYDVYSVKLYHAGSAGEDAALNTTDFYLRSINEDQTFDTDFWLGYGVADSAYYVGRNSNYYVGHATYTGNTENVTTLSLEEAIHVRSMLVHVVTPNAETDDNVRLYELEVLAVDTDQIAARRVMALIDAIGEVTEESGEAISAAREGYDALTDAQKVFVENYQTLLDAENAFGSLANRVERLQAHYDALIAENMYSSASQKKLEDLLAEGLAALENSQGQEAEAILNQYIAAMDEVLTFEEEMEAAKAAAEAAQKAAEEAQKKAEDAQAAAEAAQKAAEEAANSTAEDKAAAEKAAEEARVAQEEAEAARTAAEDAQKAAQAAADAAEEANLAAAEEAQKAAEEAAKSANSAAAAAESARLAAEAQKGAQEARQAAEEAQAAAEEAQKKAEEARKAAEEAAASAAEDKEAAEKAQAEAEAAEAAAEAARKAAEEAEAAAKAAEEAAAAHDAAAAEAAAEAAKYAKEVAEKYEEICSMKAQMAEYLLDAQKSAEEAEASRKAAEEAELACAKYYALYTLSTYADKDDYAPAQQAELAAAVKAGREAISAAGTVADVDQALADAKAAIDAIKTLEDLKLNFTDVKESDWFYEAVQFTVSEGLFKGVTETSFAPNGKMNRAMLVTTLYRLANEPEVTGTTKFTDVNENAYYYNALLWASANGIVKGVTDTTFVPGGLVTREQMVTFLYRYALLEGKDVSAKADLSGYADAGKISSFAADPMSWAVATGLIKGVDATTLAPKGTATRAQVATILMRFVENN